MPATPSSDLRLALLLAAGGHKVRRLTAVAARTGLSVAGLAAAGVAPPLLEAVGRALDGQTAAVRERIQAAGWSWITPDDAGYPPLLDHTADPPLGLFLCGSLGNDPAAAVVGSRKPTSYGLQAADHLAREVAGAGGVIVSGLARGIDSAAHRATLAEGGRTWAFLAAGPDTIYPKEHGGLAKEIAESGALVTEYLPGTPVRKHHFLERNRLIAGASRVVVVVEAAVRSGALSTARQAVDEGREVLAVPGSIFNEVAVGPNGLIRAGAAPVTCAGDVLEVLGLAPGGIARVEEDHPLSAVLARGETMAADELASRLDRPAEEVVTLLLELEMAGSVERLSDGAYRRRG